MDLTLKFDTQEIVQALGTVADGEILKLIIKGTLTNGKKFEGADCIRIIKKNVKNGR